MLFDSLRQRAAAHQVGQRRGRSRVDRAASARRCCRTCRRRRSRAAGLRRHAWFGIFAPAGTPRGLVAQLQRRRCRRRCRRPDLHERFAARRRRARRRHARAVRRAHPLRHRPVGRGDPDGQGQGRIAEMQACSTRRSPSSTSRPPAPPRRRPHHRDRTCEVDGEVRRVVHAGQPRPRDPRGDPGAHRHHQRDGARRADVLASSPRGCSSASRAPLRRAQRALRLRLPASHEFDARASASPRETLCTVRLSRRLYPGSTPTTSTA